MKKRVNGNVSGVCEVVLAFGGLDGCDEVADVEPNILDGTLLNLVHPMFDLGEGLLDGIGRVWRRYQSLAPAAFDRQAV
ncbi:MAG: hypothetical protein EOQ95_23285 [Mesorhizobium sp.]|nr:MAG: hypothetical protein EOR23_33455 [Mesorhizobium sp.]RWL96346.1 MAG: hypothetical protein EOR71_32730 [Mesorhizobium sp.]RWO85899.1 MAG: hypothetical protein EOQ95_23285 [Mesorhizobium sp.]